MLLRRHVNPLKIEWLHPPARATCASQWCSRLYSTASRQNIAIIGGGITGLVNAYYLSKRAPNAKITLYESRPRLGGWLNSSLVEVRDGKTLLEYGPRTLRSSGDFYTPRLILDLGLTDEVVYTSKFAPASLYRYIYYPDRLVQMPYLGINVWDALWKILTEPVFEGVLKGGLREIFQPPRANTNGDESVGSFIERRASKSVADNILSAVLHGIYAGDIYQLSAKSILGFPWWAEAEYGSILGAFGDMTMRGVKLVPRDAFLLPKTGKSQLPHLSGFFSPLPDEFSAKLNESSVYSFKNGIEQLTKTLEEKLRKSTNVRFRLGKPVQRLEGITKPESRHSLPVTDKIRIHRRGDNLPSEYDQVISTIFSRDLASLCTSYPTGETYLPTLAKTHAVTVMVVNLYFRQPNLLPVKGFGYLIPRSIPFVQNPERALGVIFDSDALQGQDSAPGTKVTVMLGGHWWDGWDRYPDEAEAIVMARMLLERHLKISMDTVPEVARATLQKNCIPQYTVGHFERMRSAHNHLKRYYGGRLTVAGSSYTGVGVKDCIKAAWQTVDSLVDGMLLTGLEQFESQPTWHAFKPIVMVPNK